MNSTFKVVFNKARGALMVVNEVTSSVQAKGTKTVIAAAVATMIAGVASAAPTVLDGTTEAKSSTAVVVKNPEGSATASVNGSALVLVGDNNNVTLKDQTYTTGSASEVTLSFDKDTGVAKLAGGEIKGLSAKDELAFARGAIVDAVYNNTKAVIDGVKFTDNTFKGAHGLIHTDGALAVKNSTFSGNTTAHGVIFYDTNAGTPGEDGKVTATIEKTTFSGNKSVGETGFGGAINMINGAKVEAKLVDYIGNSAEQNGGAIAINTPKSAETTRPTTYTQTGGSFKSNTSKVNGGAVTVTSDINWESNNNLITSADQKSHASFDAVIFDGNKAANGGAVFSVNGVLQFTNTTFTGNEAEGFGGALMLKEGAQATFVVNNGNELTYSGNKAGTKEATAKKYESADKLGGFMYLAAGNYGNGNSEAIFNIDKGSSLTIEDSIASEAGTTITKQGAGKLTLNDMSAAIGNLTVTGGTLEIVGDFATYDLGAQSAANKATAVVDPSYTDTTTATATVTGNGSKLVMGDVTVNRKVNFTAENSGSITMKSLTLTTKDYADLYVDPSVSGQKLSEKVVTTTGASTITGKVTVEGAVNVGNKTKLTVTSGTLTAGSINTVAEITEPPAAAAVAGEIDATGSDIVVKGTAESVNAGTLTVKDLTLKAGKFTNTGSLSANKVAVEKGATFAAAVSEAGSIGTVTTVDVKEGATIDFAKLNARATGTAAGAAFDALKLVGTNYKIDGTLAVAGQEYSGNLTLAGGSIEFGADKTFAKVKLEGGVLKLDEADLTVSSKFENNDIAFTDGKLTAGVEVSELSTLSLTADAAGFTKTVVGEVTTYDVTIKSVVNNGTVAIDAAAEFDDLDDIQTFSQKINGTVNGSKGLVVLSKGATVKDAAGYLVSESGSTAGTIDIANANLMAGMVVDNFTNTVVSGVNSTKEIKGGSFGGIMLKAEADGTFAPAKIVGGLTLNGNGTDSKLVTYTTTSGSTTTTHLGSVALATGAVLTTAVENGEIGAIKREADTATDTKLNIAEGSLTVNGEVDVAELNVYGDTTITMGKSVATDENVANMKVGTLYVGGNVVAGDINLTGTTPGSNKSEIGGTVTAKTLTIETGHTVLVGNDEEGYSIAGKLIADKISGGTVFADPAWKDGNELALDETSQVLVGTVDGSKVIAGQGSIVTVGTTDDMAAIAAMHAAGYDKLGANEGQFKSAIYVEGKSTTNEGTGVTTYTPIVGVLAATGWTSAEYAVATAPTSVQVEAGNLLVINMDTVDTSDVDGLQAVFAEDVTNDGTIYLANAEFGDKFVLTNYDGDGEIIFNGDRLMSAVEGTTAGEFTVGFDEDKLIHYESLETLDLVMAMYEEGAQRGTSKSAQFNNWLMSSTNGLEREEVIAAGNDVASIVGTAGMANVTMDALSQFNDTVAARTSVLAKNGEGVNVWADVNGGKFEGKKVMDGAGYSSDIYAGVIGVDTTVACGAKIGAALTVGTADTDSQNTTAKTSMDSDLFGISIYTAKQFGDFNVAADIGYMQASNDVNVQAYNLGNFSADSDAFTIGVRGELLAKAGSLDIVPHVGIRWTRLSIDNFEAGYTTDIKNMNVFQMPVGVTISGELEASGWTIAPAFDLSVVPTWGDKDLEATLGIGGVFLKEEGSMRVLDSNVVNATLGVAAQNGAWTFGLDYKLGVGSDDRMNNSFNARVNYAF